MAECPRVCDCKWKNGKESVLCNNANLTSIPIELEASTQVLDFTGNSVTEISKDTFSKAGLTNLQKAYLSRCKIKTLDRYAFRKLTNLVELDLSYNLLSSVPSHIFESISELRELRLSGNPIQRVSNDAFRRVPHLIRLELSECRLGTVEVRAFAGLQSLEWLKLDTNLLSSIRPSTITVLKSLHGLDLHLNPWNCSCDLRPLREWMLRQNIPYSVPPICRSPQRIATKSWDKLDLDDFACVPDITARESVVNGIEGNNVTMSCRIDGTPEPTVKWMWKNRVIANLTGYITSKKTYVFQEVINAVKSSNLTIFSAELQDAGTYVCIAENKAGKIEASVNLTMSRRALDPPLSIRILIAGIVVITLFVIAVCLMTVCICSLRHKQEVRLTRSNRGREENYEKIEMNHKHPTMNHTDGSGASGVAISPAILQTGNRHPRHTEYRGLPCDGNSPGHFKKSQDTNVMWNVRSPDEAASSEAGHNADTESCTARSTLMSDSDTSDPDAISRPHLSSYTEFSGSSIVNGSARRPSPPKYQFNAVNIMTYDDSGLFERESSIEMKDLHIHAPPLPPDPESDSRYPDVLGKSYPSEAFCTLPRKSYDQRSWKRSIISESQSPLLAESRYNSSEGSGDSVPRYLAETKNVAVRQKSSSSLNLPSDYYRESVKTGLVLVSCCTAPISSISTVRNTASRYPSLPNSPSTTPLLGEGNELSQQAVGDTNAAPCSVVRSYDYHAAQLERFLEEYRSLQEQLNKMKETCHTLRKEPSPTTRSTNTKSLVEPLLNVNALGAATSNEVSRSILKANPIQVDNTRSTSNSTAMDQPLPYWVPRNTLRRYSGGDFYQS